MAMIFILACIYEEMTVDAAKLLDKEAQVRGL